MSDTTDVYLTVFRALERTGVATSCDGNRKYQARPEALAEWLYDNGDDPSFLSSRELGKNLTWGICRQQIRNKLKVGDVFVFFAARGQSGKAPFEYLLCAVATVQQKIRQLDIWQEEEFAHFRGYRNLLTKPDGRNAWVHCEPLKGVNHDDWIWRMAEHKRLTKGDFSGLDGAESFREGTKVGSGALRIACNYVIFSDRSDETVVLERPPAVARCYQNGEPEQWLANPTAREISDMTIGKAKLYRST